MIRGKSTLRAIAVFLLVEFVTNAFLPTFSWALTGGPTAPEATTFEPVDTTDVVNLQTGDFVYNIPIIEIPGPGGNYPLSLSYHSNIQTNQEASWVGLGWSLNPGAITRLVNGYPDDHSQVTNIDREFWEGGETVTYTIGHSVGIVQGPSVTSSLSFSNDTYKGFSVDASAGVGYDFGGLAQTLTSPSNTLNGNPGQMRNSQSSTSAGLTLGVRADGVSSMGASISMGTGDFVTSAHVGISGVHNEKSGKLTVQSKNIEIPVPTAIGFIKFGRKYQRYWIDETANVETYGSLYSGGISSGYNRSFDTYDLLDTETSLAHENNPEYVLGGSFPDIDSYSVTAQGVGGVISPHFFRANLYRQDKKRLIPVDQYYLEETLTRSYPLAQELTNSPVNFRFTNDFSNRYEYAAPPIDNSNGQLSFEFTGSPLTGESGNDGIIDNNLIGARDVQWFTNKAIIERSQPNPFAQGFLDCQADGFVRDNDLQIGGFTITNETGVQYHYSLPAYSYDEIIKSQNTEKQQQTNGLYYNQLTKSEKYAYTWFLTAVTGPDYVDRNGNGLADQGDWGYWVRFDYSKLYGDYRWRNPGEGFNSDIDNFDFFSYGKKEVYHLDRVVTETHVAVFEKSPRKDSREVENIDGGFTPTTQVPDPQCVSHCEMICEQQHCPSGNCDEPARTNCINACADECYSYVLPRPTLKLDRIRLYRSQDYNNNALDNSIRTIAFSYDYSLAPGTLNSFDDISFTTLLGKLTLTSVSFLGKKDQGLIPPTKFEYKNAPYHRDHFDSWGFYKPDYSDTGNENLDRITTDVSAQFVDAWSLTKIKTPLGAEIEIQYESDRYIKPVLYNKEILTVSTVTPNTATQTIDIQFSSPPADLPALADLLAESQLTLLFRRVFLSQINCYCDNGYDNLSGMSMGNYYDTRNLVLSSNDIFSVDNNSIQIKNATLYDYLVNSEEDAYYTESPCYTSNGSEIDPPISIENPVLVSGNLFHHASQEIPGGGTRVSKITLRNTSSFRETNYEYSNGTTTYEPIQLGRVKFDYGFWEETVWTAELKRIADSKAAYRAIVYPNVSELLSVSRILPGPGVMYETVSVKEKAGSFNSPAVPLPNYKTYMFEVFKEGMIGFSNQALATSGAGQYDNIDFSKVNSKSVVLKDFTSRIGALKKESTYSHDNQLLSETVHNYLHDGLSGSFDDNKTVYEQELSDKFKSQGVTEQTFSRARIVLYKADAKKPYEEGYFSSDERHLLGVVSKLERFPLVKVGEQSRNYKTGVYTIVANDAFDFYSGEVVRRSFTDEFKNTYVTELIPAYRKYPEMGSVVSGGKNMLSQVASTSTFKIDANDPDRPKTGLLSSSVQLWSDQVPATLRDQSELVQNGIWRKHSTYVYVGDNASRGGDGLMPVVNNSPPTFTAWTPGGTSPDASWQRQDQVNRYDIYSRALQEEDINGNHASMKMSGDQTLVMAMSAGAEYGEFAYSGAEDLSDDNLFGGGVLRAGGEVNPTVWHTGAQSLKLNSGVSGFTATLRTSSKRNVYHASVWVHESNAAGTQFYFQFKDATTGVTVGALTYSTLNTSIAKKSGPWYLFNVDFPVPQNATEANYDLLVGIKNNGLSPIYVDDFRIHPNDASMVSYVYNQLGELSHILDSHNLYTEFRYDAVGRLTETWKESFGYGAVKTSNVIYHYADQ